MPSDIKIEFGSTRGRPDAYFRVMVSGDGGRSFAVALVMKKDGIGAPFEVEWAQTMELAREAEAALKGLEHRSSAKHTRTELERFFRGARHHLLGPAGEVPVDLNARIADSPIVRGVHAGKEPKPWEQELDAAALRRAAMDDQADNQEGVPMPDPPNGPKSQKLTESLRKSGLHFQSELVANYFLALQTKRFAILTGISGTGKTRIAKAVAQHFQPTVTRRVSTKIPDDAVEIEVKPSQLKSSLLTVPKVMAMRLSLLGPDAPRADRRIQIRYPRGETALTHWHAASTQLYLSGGFRKWYHSNLELGDRIWLRVLEGETPESHGLEIGLPATEFVKQSLDNYVVVPVRPDWVDNRGLLGYLNPLTDEYSTTPFLNLLLRARSEEKRAKKAGESLHPFFIILDEMNLARVEHYFSDFLSALESGEPISLHEDERIESGESGGPQVPKELKIPGNVLFTGTVNVDETTYMFSPKVLDRAFTIEFDQVDLEGFTTGESSDDGSGLTLDGGEESLDLLRSGSSGGDDWKPSREDWVRFSKETPGLQKALRKLHRILEEQHRHFGYRVATEIARFVNLAREQAVDADAAANAAFDLALLQKVLPKFHGTQQELESLLERIFQFAAHGADYAWQPKQTVNMDDWRVVAGRLVASSVSGTSSTDAGTETDEAGQDDIADSVQTATSDADAPSPVYPRTGAKVLRMLQRLRDRGFTSFIE